MIGVDIVRIERVKENFEALARRLLSPRELEQMSALAPDLRYEYLAGRFAAKEAFVKATGQKALDFQTVEIIDDAAGRPSLYYKGRPCGSVSLAHDGYAVAVVIVDKE